MHRQPNVKYAGTAQPDPKNLENIGAKNMTNVLYFLPIAFFSWDN